jgi:hypothetical protein
MTETEMLELLMKTRDRLALAKNGASRAGGRQMEHALAEVNAGIDALCELPPASASGELDFGGRP